MRTIFFVVLIVASIASYALIINSTTTEQQTSPVAEPNVSQAKTLVSDHFGVNQVSRPTRISSSSTI